MKRTYLLSAAVVIAVMIVVIHITDAVSELVETNLLYLLFASVSYVASILLWIISWAHLVRKHTPIPYSQLIAVGFTSVWGILTPFNLGSDALRAVLLKKQAGISRKTTLACSFISKALKFILIAFSALIVLIYASGSIDLYIFYTLLIGFFIILLPILFLYGSMIGRVKKIYGATPWIGEKLMHVMERFAVVHKKMGVWDFVFIVPVLLMSCVMEYLSLYFCFLAFSVYLSLFEVFLFSTAIYMISKVPWLPQGIGLVEGIGIYLAMNRMLITTPISRPEIGAVLVIWDVSRIFVPLLIAGIFSISFIKDISSENEDRKQKKQNR